MKLGDIAALAFLAIWLGPLAVGLLDSMCWFFAATQCSPVIWIDSRIAFAVLWTLIVPGVAMILLAGS